MVCGLANVTCASVDTVVSKKKKKNQFGWNYNKEKMLNGFKYACMIHECECEKDGKKKLMGAPQGVSKPLAA